MYVKKTLKKIYSCIAHHLDFFVKKRQNYSTSKCPGEPPKI